MRENIVQEREKKLAANLTGDRYDGLSRTLQSFRHIYHENPVFRKGSRKFEHMM